MNAFIFLISAAIVSNTPGLQTITSTHAPAACPPASDVDTSCFDDGTCPPLVQELAITAACYQSRYAQCQEILATERRIRGVEVAIPALPMTESSYPVIQYIAGGLIILTGGIAIGYALGQ